MAISFNILERIVRIRTHTGSVGTGTIVKIAGADFLLTAAHVIEGCHAQSTINVEGRSWRFDLKILRILRRGDLALLVLNISFDPLDALHLQVGGVGFMLGEEVYIAGFPEGQGTYVALPDTRSPAGELSPFIRRGIVSNSSARFEIILDCLLQKGFSGGPVFKRGFEYGHDPKLIAVVSSGLVFEGDRAAIGDATTTIISGFTSCIHVGLAIELIEDEMGLKHPVT